MKRLLPIATNAEFRRWLWKTISCYKREFSLVLVSLAITTIASLVGPQILGKMVSQVTSGDLKASQINQLALIFLATLGIQGAVKWFTELRARTLSERILAKTKETLTTNAVTLPLEEIEAAGTGDLTTRATVDIEELDVHIRAGAPEALIATVGVIAITIAMVVTSPLLALGLLPALPLLVASTLWHLRNEPALRQKNSEEWSKTQSLFYESGEGAATVEALSLASKRIHAIDQSLTRLSRGNDLANRYDMIHYSNLIFSYILPVSVILLLGGWAYTQNWVTLGTLTTVLLYAQALVRSLDQLIKWLESGGRTVASLRRVLGVRAAPVIVKKGQVLGNREIIVKGVRFAYYLTGCEVLHGIDLTIPQGQHLAIVGASGAGKSTLARLLTGIATPTFGSVSIGDCDISTLDSDMLRQEVLLLTQESHIFSGTLRDNLVLPAGEWTDEEIMAAMELVGATDWIKKLPEGLDARVGAGGLLMPLGIAQRIALARVILANPHTVVLDEATSLLDRESARTLENSLNKALSGRTVIAIGHRLHTAAAADRIVVMEQGRIVELGTHEELLDAGGSYAQLVHAAKAAKL